MTMTESDQKAIISRPQDSLGGIGKRHGKSIREKKDEGDVKFPPPKRVTLMALSITDGRRLRARTCWADITGNETVEDVEGKIFDIAITEDKDPLNVVQPVSSNLVGIDFEKPSYFTIVVHNKSDVNDKDKWDFCFDDKHPGYDPFMFFEEKYVLINDYLHAQKFDPNWSFFNLKKTGVRGYSAVRTTNHLKRPESEEDLGVGERSVFGFNIFLAVPLARISNDEPRAVIIIDPTGENKGPQPPGHRA